MANDLFTRDIREPALTDFVYGVSGGGGTEGRMLLSELLSLRIGAYKNIWIDAGAMVPRETDGAAPGTSESATNKVMNDYHEFAPDADQHVQFKMMMPDDWDRSDIKFKLYWVNGDAVGAGTNVAWAISANAVADGGTVDTPIGTPVQVVDTFQSTTMLHIAPASEPVTVEGAPAIGNLVYFQASRLGSEVSDTYGAPARLVGISIQYKEGASLPVIW